MSGEEAGINIVEVFKINSTNPYVIVGIPDTGLVGSIVASHLVQVLNMPEIGYVESEHLPPVMLIHKNEPKPPIRIFSSGDIVVIVTETLLSPSSTNLLTKAIVKWARERNARYVVGITGIAVPNRLEVEKPSVFAVGSVDEAKKLIGQVGVDPFEEGVLVGVYALLLKQCIKEKQPNITLLAESHMEFPDPAAAASAVEALNHLFGINVSVTDLLQKGEEIRIKARELMRRTKDQMRNLQKTQEQELQGIYV